MSSTRSLRPTDLVALVSLDGRVYPNEARTWDHLGRQPEGPSLLDSALPPWFSFATGRHTWIHIQGQTIHGLVSARKRGNRTAWEVECLIAATDDERVVLKLLEQVSAGVGRAGALKVFLRLEAGSDLLNSARRAGFVPYASEVLLRSDGHVPAAELEEGRQVRPCASTDAYALYRLYNATVPEHVRRMEAPTFHQWQATQEKRGSGRGSRNLVVLHDGEIVAHVCSCRDAGIRRIDLSVLPAHRDVIPALLHLAIEKSKGQRPIYCLVPGHDEPQQVRLHEAGFIRDGEYTAMVKRTAIPIAQLKPLRLPVPLAHSLSVVYTSPPLASRQAGVDQPREISK